MENCCERMQFFLDERRVGILYEPRFREYGIYLIGGIRAFQLMNYCPWCGAALPGSLRDEWAKQVEALGYAFVHDELPGPYQSDEWWKGAEGK